MNTDAHKKMSGKNASQESNANQDRSNTSPTSQRFQRLNLLQRLNLSNVRIGRKIGLGFAIVLLLTVGVSFLGWKGLNEVGIQLDKTDAVGLLYDEFLDIRKDEKNYQIIGDEKYYEDAVKKILDLKERTGSFKSYFDSFQDIELIDRILDQVVLYETALTKYRGLEQQKLTALDRMLQKSEEMEKTTAQLRTEQNDQFKALTEELIELEELRDYKLAIADVATNLVILMSDLLVEMEKFQITGDTVHVENFEQLSKKVVLNLQDVQALFGDDENDQFPDDMFDRVDGLRNDFKTFAERIAQGNQSEAMSIAESLEATTQSIKILLATVASGQRAEWETLADETESAKSRMQEKQAITLDASRLIESVNKNRIAQVQYRLRPTDENAEKGREWVAGIMSQLKELEANLFSEEDQQEANSIRENAGIYLGDYEDVVTFFNEQALANETMISSALTVGAEISDVKADQKSAMTTQKNQSTLFIVVGSATALVLGVIFAFFISRSITSPLSYITQNMRRLADGDTSIVLKNRRLKNEIGNLSRAMGVFLDKTIEMDRMREEQKQKEHQAEAEKREAMQKMADQFETSVGEVVEQVSSAVGEMQSSSEAMGTTAEETTRQAAAVAAASEEASANVQTVASAAEELSGSITEISRQVNHASEVARAAVEEAEETNERIKGLAEAAQKIGDVVALITDIADQTNLLALNATIEAARAGDAGKGFAVVASEVKNLANQTAKATEEIGSQIGGIQTSTQEAVAAIEGIGKIISEIDEVNSGIASAVEQQGAATQEIARNVEQAAAGTHEVSSNITGVSKAATDTGLAALQIKAATSDLSKQSEVLRSEVGRFLTSVRAA